MGNLNVNITADEVLSQKASEAAPKKQVTKFDVNNYLQTRLEKDEVSKTLTIRLLPFSPEGGSPFHKVHMHQIRVSKEVSPSGWKTVPCPVKNGLGDKCPFCDISNEARRMKASTIIEQEKQKYSDLEFANRAREMWIVRCIDRGSEDKQVKFWLFSNNKRGDGVYDKIMNIFQQRYAKAKEQGKYNNIFDLNEGKDLLVTITKDSNGKTVINVADDDEKTPLSTDYEQALAWVNDQKKWEDVYTVKSVDYMEVLAGGGVPRYDKTLGKYVDAEEVNANREAEIEKNLTVPADELAEGKPMSGLGNVAEVIADENDLPF